MFNKLKSLFTKEEPDQSEDDHDDFTFLENPNFITDQPRIHNLLSEIENSSPLCTIKIEGESVDCNSSILGINKEKNLIILDELVPAEANARLQKTKALKLTTFHKGIHLAFSLTNIEIGHSKGITYYKAAIPERIFYPQRRRAPRIEISSIDIAFSGVSERTGLSVNGFLFDLSRGGAGVDLAQNRARIQRGDRIKNCQIVFEDYTMDFDLAVRFVKQPTAGSARVQIGGHFEKLSNKSQSKLSYFITSLERVEIRKQKA